MFSLRLAPLVARGLGALPLATDLPHFPGAHSGQNCPSCDHPRERTRKVSYSISTRLVHPGFGNLLKGLHCRIARSACGPNREDGWLPDGGFG